MAVTKRALRPVEHPNNVEQAVSDSARGMALATVPDERYAEEYISRYIEGLPDMAVLRHAYGKAMNVLLYGPTGPGKTSFVMAFAALERLPFYSVASNLALDPSQMFGKFGPNENGGFSWYDGGVTDIVRHGGVLLVNEVNFMSDRIAPVIYELLDKRREISLLDHKGEKVRAHRPGKCWCDLPAKECKKRWVLIVADMNPDYSGTRPLNAAFRNRFSIQIEWGYDEEVEKQLVKSETLLMVARNIRKQIGRDIDTPVATNMLQEFEAIAYDLGIGWAIRNFVNHFSMEEQGAVKGAFDVLLSDLENDFKTPLPGAEDWNQFENGMDGWMFEEDEDED